MRAHALLSLLLSTGLGACVAAPQPHLVWEGEGAPNHRSIPDVIGTLQPGEPGRDGAPWGTSPDATFQILRTTVAEHPHVHDDHDLSIVLMRGRGILTVAERSYAVGAGDVLHVGRGRVHWFRPDPAEPVVAVAIFTPRLEGADTRLVGSPPTGAVETSNDGN